MKPDASAIEPFVGLRPFEPDDAHLFFGREAQLEELLARLYTQRYVVVMGASGSGKSSLVRAGLIPTLERERSAPAAPSWRIAVMRPGGNPIGHLAQVLASSRGPHTDGSAPQEAILEAVLRRGSLGLVDAVRELPLGKQDRLLIVVDQFEELFRFKRAHDVADAANHATAFVKLLLDVLRQDRHPVHIVLTMRSDALSSCSEFHGLPELINEGLFLIPRLNRDQLGETIVKPVAVAGATVSPSLVQRLLNDVGDDPDQLPVLQHALMRMWRQMRGEGRTHLTLEHYTAIKGLNAALSDHADEAYDELDLRQQRIARKAFKCLTERGPDNLDVRRPTTLGELCDVADARPEEVIAVLEHFRREGRSFVTPSGSQPLTADTFIDISHESLIRKWARLQQWVSEEVDDKKLFIRLSDSAAAHAAGKESPWRHPLLGMALKWHESFRPTAAWARRYGRELGPSLAFLDVSRKAQNVRWYARRAAFALVVLAVPVAWLIYQLLQDARLEAERADEKVALANREAQVARDERAVVESRAKLDLQAQQILLASAKSEAEQKEILAQLAQQKERVAELARYGVILDSSKQLFQNDREAGVLVSLMVLQRAAGVDEAATAAEKSLREGLSLLKPRLWEQRVRGGMARVIAGPGGGPSLLLTSTNSAVTLWDATDGPIPARLQNLEVRSQPVVGVAGRSVAWTTTGGIQVWNAASRQTTTIKGSSSDRILAVASDASCVLVTSKAGTELRSSNDTRRLEVAGAVARAAFSPDDRLLAIAAADKVNVIQLWQVAPLEKLGESPVQGVEDVRHVVFSPNAGYLAVTAEDRLWIQAIRNDPKGRPTLVRVASGKSEDPQGITDLGFSQDEQYLAVAGASGRIRILNFRTRAGTLPPTYLPQTRPMGARVDRVALSGDGRLVAASLADRTVRVWQRSDWTEVAVLPPGAPAPSGAFSTAHELTFVSRPGAPDAYRLATGDASGSVKLWDVGDTPLENDRNRLVQQACSRVRRPLKAEEWLLYFRAETYESPCPKTALDLADVLNTQIGFARANDAPNARAAFRLPTRSQDVAPEAVLNAAYAQFEVGNVLQSSELFRRAADMARTGREINDASKAGLNNTVCWQGAIRGFAKEVLASCDEAVKLAPKTVGYRDSRGVAYALLDNRPAAIADFEAYVNDGKGSRPPDEIRKRDEWIKGLKGKENPFVRDRDKVLADLRDGS